MTVTFENRFISQAQRSSRGTAILCRRLLGKSAKRKLLRSPHSYARFTPVKRHSAWKAFRRPAIRRRSIPWANSLSERFMTAVLLAPEAPRPPAEVAPLNYLNVSRGVASWLLTKDHKRIAILYLLPLTAMFFIG